MSVKISSAYLHQNRNKNGAWTAKQLATIGIKWPLTKGWKKRAVGKVVTDAQATEFESYRKGGNEKPKEKRNAEIDKLLNNIKKKKTPTERITEMNKKRAVENGTIGYKEKAEIENDQLRVASTRAMEKGSRNTSKMDKIRKYAKANKVTISQAMIHFM